MIIFEDMNATSKSNIQVKKAVEMLKAIAHPIRLEIIDLLNSYETPLCVKEIQDYLNLDQAVVSQHLKILKEKEIIGFDKNGKHCFYFIKNKGLNSLLNCIKNCQSC